MRLCCVKCGGELLREENNNYLCIYCGMRGTPEQMRAKIGTINKIIDDTEAMSKCFICGEKRKAHDLREVRLNFKTGLACLPCIKQNQAKIVR
jgi:hypothetical protein